MPQWTLLRSADGAEIPAFEAQPQGAPLGGVVVLQEIFGVNAHIQEVVTGFAAAGYWALAPALFHRVRPGVALAYKPEDIAQGQALKAEVEALPAPGVLPDVQAAVDALAAKQTAGVGVVGFCWGGLMAWRCAAQLRGLSAAVCYYGGGMTLPQEVARQPRVPVLAHFAEHDHHIPLEGVRAWAAAHPEVTLHLYDAQHGFNCDHRGAYHAPSAELARSRTLAFWAEHLQR